MNKERILALADLIEVQPHVLDDIAKSGFQMDRVTHRCGTPACIAGWAAWEALDRPKDIKAVQQDGDYRGLEDIGAEYLEIGLWSDQKTDQISQPLFYPPNFHFLEYRYITPQQAAKVLRHLAETGVVDWGIE